MQHFVIQIITMLETMTAVGHQFCSRVLKNLVSCLE